MESHKKALTALKATLKGAFFNEQLAERTLNEIIGLAKNREELLQTAFQETSAWYYFPTQIKILQKILHEGDTLEDFYFVETKLSLAHDKYPEYEKTYQAAKAKILQLIASAKSTDELPLRDGTDFSLLQYIHKNAPKRSFLRQISWEHFYWQVKKRFPPTTLAEFLSDPKMERILWNDYTFGWEEDWLVLKGDLKLWQDHQIQMPEKLKILGDCWIQCPLESLPKHLWVGGNFQISNPFMPPLPRHLSKKKPTLEQGIHLLPETLTVMGTMSIFDLPIADLPDNLSIGSGLEIFNTFITRLPETLQLGGNLFLYNTPITHLPDDLTVPGNLTIKGVPLQALPKNLLVLGNAEIYDTNITALPDDFRCNGHFDPTKLGLKVLPDNFILNGEFKISGKKIKKLPKNLTVNGELTLRDFKLDQLPDDLTIKGRLILEKIHLKKLTGKKLINHSLTLKETVRLPALPDDLTVHGDFKIYTDEITALPLNLTVSIGQFELKNTQIRSIPKNLKVVYWCNIFNCPITEFPAHLLNCQSLSLIATGLRSLPENLVIENWVGIFSVDHTFDIPNSVVVKGGLSLKDIRAVLPDDWTVDGDLHLTGKCFTHLPENLHVKGVLYLFETSSLTMLPQSLQAGKITFYDSSEFYKFKDQVPNNIPTDYWYTGESS